MRTCREEIMLKLPKYSSIVLLVCIALAALIYRYSPSIADVDVALASNILGGVFFSLVTVCAFGFVYVSNKAQ